MPNALATLRALLPDAPLLTGTITSAASGVYTITLTDGSIVQARGLAGLTTGQAVWVQGGVIQGQATSISLTVIEI